MNKDDKTTVPVKAPPKPPPPKPAVNDPAATAKPSLVKYDRDGQPIRYVRGE
jgi:hypothetical protein